jgi:hypothetical protein
MSYRRSLPISVTTLLALWRILHRDHPQSEPAPSLSRLTFMPKVLI